MLGIKYSCDDNMAAPSRNCDFQQREEGTKQFQSFLKKHVGSTESNLCRPYPAYSAESQPAVGHSRKPHADACRGGRET